MYHNLKNQCKSVLIKTTFFFFQHAFSFTGSDFFFKPTTPFTMVPDDILSTKTSTKSVQSKSLFKEAMFYHDNWSNSLESGFQLLNKFSEKGIESSSTKSSRSLFSIMTSKEKCSQSSSSNFSVSLNDFLEEKLHGSKCSSAEKNSTSEFCLLDSFVDNPISHKFPSKITLRAEKRPSSSVSSRSSDKNKDKCRILPELAEEKSSVWDFYEKDIMGGDVARLSSIPGDSKNSFLEVIETLRKPIKEESFSELYNKHLKLKQKDGLSPSSKSSQKIKLAKKPSSGVIENPKDVVLGLWEQEYSLIREFTPDLSVKWPQLKILDLAEYVRDVKYLLTGINTSTFQYDEEKSAFFMNYGTCLDGITPESLYNFSEEFLNIGTFYVRLSKTAVAHGKNIQGHSRIICQVSRRFF